MNLSLLCILGILTSLTIPTAQADWVGQLDNHSFRVWDTFKSKIYRTNTSYIPDAEPILVESKGDLVAGWAYGQLYVHLGSPQGFHKSANYYATGPSALAATPSAAGGIQSGLIIVFNRASRTFQSMSFYGGDQLAPEAKAAGKMLCFFQNDKLIAYDTLKRKFFVSNRYIIGGRRLQATPSTCSVSDTYGDLHMFEASSAQFYYWTLKR